MEYSVIILAAGSGTRMNLGYNKVYYKLKDETYLLEKTMENFLKDDRCKQVVVVTDIDEFKSKIGYKNNKICLCKGGSSRQESVFLGMHMVTSENVLIHDGARCFIDRTLIDRVVATLKDYKACLCMLKCVDTVKRVENGVVIKTLDREVLRLAQTPQAFKTDLIFKASLLAKKEGFITTDDAALIERYFDVEIREVEGDHKNIKVTHQNDLEKLNF